MKITKIILSAPLCILILSGCVSQTMKDSVSTSVASKESDQLAYFAKSSPIKSKSDREASQEVNMPFLAGKSVPLARNVSLPRALQNGVNTAVLFPKNSISLSAAAERIMLASGLNVSIAQDVYIDDAMLMPKILHQIASLQVPCQWDQRLLLLVLLVYKNYHH